MKISKGESSYHINLKKKYHKIMLNDGFKLIGFEYGNRRKDKICIDAVYKNRFGELIALEYGGLRFKDIFIKLKQYKNMDISALFWIFYPAFIYNPYFNRVLKQCWKGFKNKGDYNKYFDKKWFNTYECATKGMIANKDMIIFDLNIIFSTKNEM